MPGVGERARGWPQPGVTVTGAQTSPRAPRIFPTPVARFVFVPVYPRDRAPRGRGAIILSG